MSITSSAGYSQYAEALMNPIFADRLLGRAYCSFIAGDITNINYAGELKKCGDQITYRLEPEVTIRDYQKNQELQPEELESESITMTVNKAKYYNVKLDRVDEKQVCFIDEWTSAFIKRAEYNLKRQIDPEVLMDMVVDASPNNKGMKAGKISATQELGEAGNPIPITAANIIEYLTRLDIVLREACRWEDGKMFVVLPNVARNALMGSDLKAAYLTGSSQSPILNGKFPMVLMGFNVYFSDQVPKVFDNATGKNAYWILAGHKDATGFAQQLEEHEIVNQETSFGKYYRGLWVYGDKVFLRDAIAAGYVSF